MGDVIARFCVCVFNATNNAKAGQTAAAALGGAKVIHQDGWRRKDGCGSSQPMVAWQGVTTNAEGRVIGLELDGNRLAGIIPPQLSDLDALEQLSLRMNRLDGDIPSCLLYTSPSPRDS